MRNPKFVSVKPNYRKRVLETVLKERGRSRCYSLPFGVLPGGKPGARNPFVEIAIEKELFSQGVSYKLKDGTTGSFPSDFVLYHCDPAYDWTPLNQLKEAVKKKLKEKGISIRTLAEAMGTSPSQVVRLLRKDEAPKRLVQLCRLACMAGCEIDFTLKKKIAA